MADFAAILAVATFTGLVCVAYRLTALERYLAVLKQHLSFGGQ